MVDYIKQTWEDAPSSVSPIESMRLNHMEDGIFAAQTTANEALAAVGHLAWTELLNNDPGTSSTPWLGGTGTWSYGNTYGININSASQDQYNSSSLGRMSWRAIRATIRFNSNVGTGYWVGFGFGGDATGWNAGDLSIGVNNVGLQWDTSGVGGSSIACAGLAVNTDIDLYVVEDRFNGVYRVYVNGAFIYPVPLSSRHNLGRVTLYSRNLTGSFRNIWIWNGDVTPSLPQAV